MAKAGILSQVEQVAKYRFKAGKYTGYSFWTGSKWAFCVAEKKNKKGFRRIGFSSLHSSLSVISDLEGVFNQWIAQFSGLVK